MIDEIRAKFASGNYEYSRHAFDQRLRRLIATREIEEAIQSGEVIEAYPDDKYGPSCLILGWTKDGRPLHVQCSYPDRPVLKVITTYEPDPVQWIGWRERR